MPDSQQSYWQSSFGRTLRSKVMAETSLSSFDQTLLSSSYRLRLAT